MIHIKYLHNKVNNLINNFINYKKFSIKYPINLLLKGQDKLVKIKEIKKCSLIINIITDKLYIYSLYLFLDL